MIKNTIDFFWSLFGLIADLRLSVIILVFMVGVSSRSQTFTIATYNCENAFDTIHDEGKNDYEYLPDGNRHWTRYRMFQKLKNIGKVIVSIDSVRPVDVVCLNEVENDTVMTYLLGNTPLARLGYKYIMTNSLDERGIDVALIYSPLTFHLISYKSIRPRVGDKYPTRDVLYASGWVAGGDTIDVFAVHLPSKRNGKESEKNRSVIIGQIIEQIDSLREVREKLNVVVLGDMNDGPDSKVIKNGFSSLHNLMTIKDRSYKYQGQWDCIDQIFVTDALMEKVEASGVAAPQYLLEPDEKFSGKKPKRTYLGFKYNAGFSDHLPVFARFRLK